MGPKLEEVFLFMLFFFVKYDHYHHRYPCKHWRGNPEVEIPALLLSGSVSSSTSTTLFKFVIGLMKVCMGLFFFFSYFLGNRHPVDLSGKKKNNSVPLLHYDVQLCRKNSTVT